MDFAPGFGLRLCSIQASADSRPPALRDRSRPSSGSDKQIPQDPSTSLGISPADSRSASLALASLTPPQAARTDRSLDFARDLAGGLPLGFAGACLRSRPPSGSDKQIPRLRSGSRRRTPARLAQARLAHARKAARLYETLPRKKPCCWITIAETGSIQPSGRNPQKTQMIRRYNKQIL